MPCSVTSRIPPHGTPSAKQSIQLQEGRVFPLPRHTKHDTVELLFSYRIYRRRLDQLQGPFIYRSGPKHTNDLSPTNTGKKISWLSDETFNLIKRKRRAFRKDKKMHKEGDTCKYKSINNTVRALTRRDHNIHLDDITTNPSISPKRFCNWIRSFRESISPVPHLYHQGSTHKSPAEKAQALNCTSHRYSLVNYLMAFMS